MHPAQAPLSIDERLHIDKVCLAFESAWQGAETPPSLDAYLKEANESERAELLRQLLLLDLDYRQRRGEAPGREDYYRLFPADKQTIDDVLGTSGPSLGVASPGTMPRSFGDYELLEEIGRGGMGVVYKAEQVSLKRRVALKMLPFAAVLDPGQLRRFKKEAQAAAQLHHTHIVPVFSIGCERGVHYYAMQYIEGHPLTAVIRELRHLGELESIDEEPRSDPVSLVASSLATGRWVPGEMDAKSAPGTTFSVAGDSTGSEVGSGLGELTPGGSAQGRAFFRSVADLGIQAAEALEHAHQQGIVHRDIKPSNLLLDVRGHLWITDFGLALIQTDTTQTLPGDLVGTIRYMSPEQAMARRVPLDHRTDIYSLGVTLYELLTLRPAFPGDDRQELLHQIAFEDPRPLRKLNHRIPRELETIIGKAIAKNPAERFSTGQEMADDLRRFLENRPIQAKPPTLMDRATKWCRRHRSVVAAAVGLLVLAVVGLTASTVMIGREQARTEAALARAQLGFETADRQRRHAEENFQHARDAVDRMLTQAAEKLADVPHMEHVRRALLEDALEFYQEFLAERNDDPDVRSEAGRAYRRAGEINELLGQEEQAEAFYAQAIALFENLAGEFPEEPEHGEELAKACRMLGKLRWRMGRAQEGEAPCRRALTILQALIAQFPGQPDYRCHLGIMLNDLGLVLGDTGRDEEAEQSYRQSLAVLEKLNTDFPNEPEYQAELARIHNNLGACFDRAGQQGEQEAAFRQAAELQEKLAAQFPGNPKYKEPLSLYLNNLGNVLRGSGRPQEAEEVYPRAMALREELTSKFPSVPRYWRRLLETHQDQARFLSDQKRLDEAEKMHRKALATLEKLSTDSPGSPVYRIRLASTHRSLGYLLQSMTKHQEASEAFWKCAEICEELTVEFPTNADYHRGLGFNLRIIGDALGGEESIAAYRKSIEVLEKSAAAFPDDPGQRRELMHGHRNLAGRLHGMGRLEEEEATLREAIQVSQTLVRDFHEQPEDLNMLAHNYAWLASLLVNAGRLDEVERPLNRAVEIREALVSDFPGEPAYRVALFEGHNLLGEFLLKAGQPEKAEAFYRKALAIREQLVADFPDKLEYREQLVLEYRRFGNLLKQVTNPEGAEELLRERLAACESLTTALPDMLKYRGELGWAHCDLGHLLNATGRHVEAEQAYGKAIEVFEALAADSPDDANVSWQREEVGAYWEPLPSHTWWPEMPRLSWWLEMARCARATATSEKLIADAAATPDDRWDLGRKYRTLGYLLHQARQSAESETAYRRAIEIGKALVNELPTESKYIGELAGGYRELAASLPLPESEELYREALKLLEKLATDLPGKPEYRDVLADTYRQLAWKLKESDRGDDAEAIYHKRLAVWEGLVADFPDKPNYRFELGWAHSDLALLFSSLERYAEAEQAFGRAVQVFEALAADFPGQPDLRLRPDLPGLNWWLEAARRGQRITAERRLIENLTAEASANPKNRLALSLSYRRLGAKVFHKRFGGWVNQFDEAQAACNKAIEIQAALVSDFPGNTEYVQELVGSYRALGNMLAGSWWAPYSADVVRRAKAAFAKAIELQAKRAADFPDEPEHRNRLAAIHREAAWMLISAKRPDEAATAFGQSVTIWTGLMTEFPDSAEYRYHLGVSQHDLGNLLRDAGKHGEAQEAYRQAIDVFDSLVGEPDQPSEAYQLRLAEALNSLIVLLKNQGRLEEAEKFFREALARRVEEATQQPEAPRHAPRLTAWLGTYAHLGVLVLRAGQADDYRDRFRQTAALTTGVAVRHRQHRACLDFGIVLFEIGLHQEARRLFREEVASLEKSSAAAPDQAADYWKLAWLLVACPDPEIHDPARATELAKKAVQLAPASLDSRQTLGRAHYRLGEWQAAADTLENLLVPGSEDASIMFYLAMAQRQLGDKSKARTWYERAVKQPYRPLDVSGEAYRLKIEAAKLLGIDEQAPQ